MEPEGPLKHRKYVLKVCFLKVVSHGSQYVQSHYATALNYAYILAHLVYLNILFPCNNIEKTQKPMRILSLWAYLRVVKDTHTLAFAFLVLLSISEHCERHKH